MSSFFSFLTQRNILAVVLALGVVQIVLYWLVAAAASADGTTPIPQPDTLLYCQAARRIVEGAPFSFSEGTAVSTGTTSVLVPFILAVPYALGWKGPSLLTAGFVLNGLFYLVFLFGWTRAFGRWCAYRLGAALASGLLALFGQPAFSALAQSDIGLWLAVSGLLAWSLAEGRFRLLASMLVLAPWVRPEGMVCGMAFVGVGIVLAVARLTYRYTLRDWILAAMVLASIAGVFALNYGLTGTCQFSSVAEKGHFANLPFASAVHRTSSDFLEMVKAFFFGAAGSAPRSFWFLPVWGGVFCGLGLVHVRCRKGAGVGLAVMALAGLGGLMTVAQSGWQNTNFDRYLAWVMPLAIFLSAEGVMFVQRLLKRRGGVVRLLPMGTQLLFTGAGCVVALCVYARNCAHMEGERLFMVACEQAMEPHAAVGGFCGAGASYLFSPRRFAHLSGIYSPEFLGCSEVSVIEELKYRPEKRFAYWLLDSSEDLNCVATGVRDEVLGVEVLVGPFRHELRKADWTSFDAAARAPSVRPGEGVLCARVDVGYRKDEEAANYRTFDRFARPAFGPIVVVDKLGGKRVIDAARLIVGGDEMRIRTKPGRPLTVVMRTLANATTTQTDGIFSEVVAGKFGPTLSLRVLVDGREATIAKVACPSNGFADVSFTIPGTSFTRTESEIAFLGDHVACGYWFFQ